MSTPNTKKYTPFGFTLVELIVVITILVILGTIAFTSLSGYSGSARDSSRISDLTNISKGLDIAYAKINSYPMPDSSFTVTYSGGNVWYQGEVGTTVMNILTSAGAKLSKQPPLDPLVTTAKYTYSKVAYAKDSYQLKANWEGDKIAYNNTTLIPQAQAASGNPTVAYIAGNYNGVVAKTQTGTMTYILAVPSIISNTGSIGLILAIDSAQKSLSGTLLVNGGSNTTGVTYNPQVAYASGSLPSTTAEKTALATGIATVYSGTSLVSSSNIQPYITAYSTNDTVALASLGGNAVASVGGGNVVSAVAVASFNCGTSTVAGRSPDTTVYQTVMGEDGKCWLASNLGTAKVATGSTDSAAYGWLYQWGRLTDGHQIPTSGSSATLSTTDIPGNANFIKSPNIGFAYDWRSPQNNSLSGTWGGVNGTSSPCPIDWRLPTNTEWTSLVSIANIIDLDTAFNSYLKLTAPGNRGYSDGIRYLQDTTGFYWSSSIGAGTSYYLKFNAGGVTLGVPNYRAQGFSVRCLKN